MPMTCKPVGWTVLIEELKRSIPGEIVIPDSKDPAFIRHVVIAVGDPRITTDGREIPIPVKVGDEIVINLEGGVRTFKGLPNRLFGGRDFAIVDCDWIKGVLSGEADVILPKIVKATAQPILVH